MRIGYCVSFFLFGCGAVGLYNDSEPLNNGVLMLGFALFGLTMYIHSFEIDRRIYKVLQYSSGLSYRQIVEDAFIRGPLERVIFWSSMWTLHSLGMIELVRHRTDPQAVPGIFHGEFVNYGLTNAGKKRACKVTLKKKWRTAVDSYLERKLSRETILSLRRGFFLPIA